MPTDFRDLLAHAQQLSDQAPHPSELCDRAVVSRAYYAVHHAAKHLADKLALPEATKDSKGSHQRLYNRLIECEPGHTPEYMKVRQIGYMAAQVLKPYRTWADYNLAESAPGVFSSSADAREDTLKRGSLLVGKAQEV